VFYEIKVCRNELPCPLSNYHEVELVNGEKMYYVEISNEIIAYLSVTNIKADGKIVFTNIPALSVDIEYQNNGIGTALLKRALGDIEQNTIAVYPYEESEAAKNILGKLSKCDLRICLDEKTLKTRLRQII
jgi:ribosomal protein S18 acetylase RimI-like enzyme